MGAKVEFVRPEGVAASAIPVRITAPAAAVVDGPAGARVWVVENEKVSPRTIELGVTRGDRIEVRSGLSGGERVVLSPPASLADGARVRVVGS